MCAVFALVAFVRSARAGICIRIRSIRAGICSIRLGIRNSIRSIRVHAVIRSSIRSIRQGFAAFAMALAFVFAVFAWVHSLVTLC